MPMVKIRWASISPLLPSSSADAAPAAEPEHEPTAEQLETLYAAWASAPSKQDFISGLDGLTAALLCNRISRDVAPKSRTVPPSTARQPLSRGPRFK